MDLNQRLFETIFSFVHMRESVGEIVPFLADTLPVILVVCFVAFLLMHNHEEEGKGLHSVVTLFASAGVGFGFSGFLKSTFSAPRPFATLDITPLVSSVDVYSSFPSGHVMFFATIATVMWFYHRGISTALFLSAILIGFARVAAGIHWPIDVLGGLGIGIFVGLAVHHGYYALLGFFKRKA